MAASKPSNDHKMKSSYTLTIFLESPIRGGSCYLGLEETTGNIFRLRQQDGRFVWWEFTQWEVGKTYTFMRGDNGHTFPFNEDISVSSWRETGVKTEVDDSIAEPVFEKLLPIARPSVEEVFNFQVNDRTYVNEGCATPAFGIWKYSGREINIYQLSDDYRQQQKRISLGEYDFPYKGFLPCGKMEITETDTPYMVVPESGNSLVVLGLSEPFEGPAEAYNPKRCHIMVFGILFNKFKQWKASTET